MALSDLSLNQIQLFLQAADFRSFTATAAYFHTTQSAVSKSIAGMESALGFPLFHRGRGQLTLTEPGQYLSERWQGLMGSLTAAVQEAERRWQDRQVRLTIGVPDSLDSGWESPYLSEFQRRYPEVELNYHVVPANQLLPRLETGALDAVITGFYETPVVERMGFSWKACATAPNLAIMHRSHPLAGWKTLRMEDLRDQELLMLSPMKNASYFEYVYRRCAQHGFQPKFQTLLPGFRSMMEALLRTHRGIILSTRFMFEADNPELRCPEIECTRTGMILVWKGKEPPDPLRQLIRAFPTAEKPPAL